MSGRKKEKDRRKLPEPNIKAVSESADTELWDILDFDGESVGDIYLNGGIDPAIYISLDNRHFRKVLTSRSLNENIVEDVNDRYVSAIAYHLLLMHVDAAGQTDVGEELESSEERDQMEKDRLAQTVAALAMPLEAF